MSRKREIARARKAYAVFCMLRADAFDREMSRIGHHLADDIPQVSALMLRLDAATTNADVVALTHIAAALEGGCAAPVALAWRCRWSLSAENATMRIAGEVLGDAAAIELFQLAHAHGFGELARTPAYRDRLESNPSFDRRARNSPFHLFFHIFMAATPDQASMALAMCIQKLVVLVEEEYGRPFDGSLDLVPGTFQAEADQLSDDIFRQTGLDRAFYLSQSISEESPGRLSAENVCGTAPGEPPSLLEGTRNEIEAPTDYVTRETTKAAMSRILGWVLASLAGFLTVALVAMGVDIASFDERGAGGWEPVFAIFLVLGGGLALILWIGAAMLISTRRQTHGRHRDLPPPRTGGVHLQGSAGPNRYEPDPRRPTSETGEHPPTPENPPPGWYHPETGPSGTQRYWDGAKWTDERRPGRGSHQRPC